MLHPQEVGAYLVRPHQRGCRHSLVPAHRAHAALGWHGLEGRRACVCRMPCVALRVRGLGFLSLDTVRASAPRCTLTRRHVSWCAPTGEDLGRAQRAQMHAHLLRARSGCARHLLHERRQPLCHVLVSGMPLRAHCRAEWKPYKRQPIHRGIPDCRPRRLSRPLLLDVAAGTIVTSSCGTRRRANASLQSPTACCRIAASCIPMTPTRYSPVAPTSTLCSTTCDRARTPPPSSPPPACAPRAAIPR